MHGGIGQELKSRQYERVIKAHENTRHGLDPGNRQQHDPGGQRWIGQPQCRLDNQPQGTFRAYEQVSQVIAAGVLDQPAIALQQFAPAIDDLQPGHAIPCQAVTQNPDTTGVGGNIATDL